MNLRVDDSRRLTGGNLYWNRPAAILDIATAGDGDGDGGPETGTVIGRWQHAARQLLKETGRPEEETVVRQFAGGASLLISAPIDALYSMCELNEVAWAMALAASGLGDPVDFAAEVGRLNDLFEAEHRPRLLLLQAAARERGVPFLWDDDHVSVGYGAHSICWPREQLPSVDEVDWAEAASLPLALVTGTNGKSTTVRMVAAIMAAQGLRGGLTSTDFIRVGRQVIERGDYSGTGGARQLLRHPDVQMAVLEVARGGLLRRGLAVEQADVALITNVAADHLGEYGINTVAELIEAKFIVHRAITGADPLVLNADDEGLVAYALKLQQQRPLNLWWFSLDAGHDLIRRNREQGRGACWVEDGRLFSNACPPDEGGLCLAASREITTVSGISASRQGLLVHNVRNAMGATLVSQALGLSDEAISGGLRDFRGDEADNPGRGNWFEFGGVKILVDFAHNEHGLTALVDSLKSIESGRVILLLGQAGDRSDEAIRGLSRIACTLNPARLLVCEFPGYERGRGSHEVPELICAEAKKCGIPENRIECFSSPSAGAKSALEEARSGDLLVLLALMQREEVLELVRQFGRETNG